MNNTLRLQLIDAGFADRTINNSLVAGCKPSPTLSACYQTELYADRKTIWGLKKKAIKARDYARPYIRVSKAKILAAMAFEERFQAIRKADRDLSKGSRSPRQPKETTRKGDWNESLC
jgi:hypothetical protein